MSKKDFIDRLAKNNAIGTKTHAKEVVDAVLETLAISLAEDEEVRFIGFGTFKVKTRAARKGTNPQTGKECNIPASKSISFKTGQSLKEFINR